MVSLHAELSARTNVWMELIDVPFLRVIHNILTQTIEGSFVTDDMFVIVSLPTFSTYRLTVLINVLSGLIFPVGNDLRELGVFFWGSVWVRHPNDLGQEGQSS